MKLLNEQPLSKISVRDIVEDCGINRNSFYYHFQDIPSLIEEIIKEEADKHNLNPQLLFGRYKHDIGIYKIKNFFETKIQ